MSVNVKLASLQMDFLKAMCAFLRKVLFKVDKFVQYKRK